MAHLIHAALLARADAYDIYYSHIGGVDGWATLAEVKKKREMQRKIETRGDYGAPKGGYDCWNLFSDLKKNRRSV
jgi:hypothetical protein